MAVSRLGGFPSPTSGSAGEWSADCANNTGTFGARSVRQLSSREEPWSAISQRVSNALQARFARQEDLSQTFENESGAPTASFFEDLGSLNALPPGDSFFDLSFDSSGDPQIAPPPENSGIGSLFDTELFSNPLSSFEPSTAFGEDGWRATTGTAPQYAQPAPFHANIQRNEPWVRDDEMPPEIDIVESDRDAASSEVSSDQEASAEDDQALKKTRHREKKIEADRQRREKIRKGKGLLQKQQNGEILNPAEQKLVDLYLRDRDLSRARTKKYRAKCEPKKSQKEGSAPKALREKAREGRDLLREQENGKTLNPDEQELVSIYRRQRILDRKHGKTYYAKRKAKESQEGEEAPKTLRTKRKAKESQEGEDAPKILHTKRKAKVAQEGVGPPNTYREKRLKGRGLFQEKTSGRLLNFDEQKLVDLYLQDRIRALTAQIAKMVPAVPILASHQSLPQETLSLNYRQQTSLQCKQTELRLLQESNFEDFYSGRAEVLADPR